jgi:hypothetical protein
MSVAENLVLPEFDDFDFCNSRLLELLVFPLQDQATKEEFT